MKRRGRPVLGGIAGLLFGLGVGLDLTIFGVRTLDALSIVGAPAIGLVAGILLGMWAPFGKRSRAASG